MSAFVVSKADIDILVTAYLALRGSAYANEEADKIGRMLWRENVLSVAYRYQMPERCGAEHADYIAAIEAYAFEPIYAKAAAVAKIARCYDYQSCEHPDWEASEARTIADLLMAAFPATLHGYDDAPWGISDARDLASARV